MKCVRHRRLVALGFTLAVGGVASIPLGTLPTSRAESPADNSAAGGVAELKTEAFKAIRGGKFDLSNQLLAKAAAISHDPAISNTTRKPPK